MGARLAGMMCCEPGDVPARDDPGDGSARGYEMRLDVTDFGDGIVVGGHPLQTDYQEIVHGLCPRLLQVED